jgi:hypothetical protein
MPFVPDYDGHLAEALDITDFLVYELDHRAGSVDVFETPTLHLFVSLEGRTMALKNDDSVGRHFIKTPDDLEAFLYEIFDDVFIVNDLAQHVVLALRLPSQEAVDKLEGFPHSEAVAQCLGKNDFHPRLPAGLSSVI